MPAKRSVTLPKGVNDYNEFHEYYEQSFLRRIIYLGIPSCLFFTAYHLYYKQYLESGVAFTLLVLFTLFLYNLTKSKSLSSLSTGRMIVSRLCLYSFIIYLIYSIGFNHQISRTPYLLLFPVFLFFSRRPKEKIFIIISAGLLVLYILLNSNFFPSLQDVVDFKSRLLLVYIIVAIIVISASEMTHKIIQNLFEYQKELKEKNQTLETEIQYRKNTEKALIESEENYKKLIENLHEAIFTIDSNGTILYVSKPIENILGYAPEEIIGKSFVEYIYQHDLPEVMNAFEDLKNNKLYPSEYRVRSKSGEFKWIRSYSRPIDSNQMQGLIIDIHQQKHKDLELEKSEKRFKAIFESANDGILISDFNKNLIHSNRKISQMLGYSKDEIKKLTVHDIHPKEVIPKIDEVFNQMISDQISVTTDIPVQTKHKSIFYADISSSCIEIDNEDYIMGIFRDVTDAREYESKKAQLEKQLLQSEKMRAIGTLAGGVAHDFNNILSPIIGHSEILLVDLDKDDTKRDSIKEIYGSALRAKDLVRQILTFSRKEEGDQKPIKIETILAEVINMVRSTVPPSVIIESSVDKDCCFIEADPTQIHQVIMNVLTNAHQSLENQDGTISIQLSNIAMDSAMLPKPNMQPGLYNLLSVNDTGSGMDDVTLQRIFEPFFTTKEPGKGTGLGMALVHNVIESLNGAIEIESEPGKGTQFYIYFPCARKEFQSVKMDDKPIRHGTGNILFVDDEVAVVNMSCKILKKLGYEVDGYSDPIEALSQFKSDPMHYDLVITDMTMPKLTGDQFAKNLLAIRSDMPIIICTGHTPLLDREGAIKIGVKDMVMKPVSMSMYSRMIEKLLK